MQYQPYAGNGKPFIFAIYSKQDSFEAQSILENMAERGYSIWPASGYDKRRVDKAALMLLFLSPDSAADDTINRAVNYAIEKNKAVLIIHLAPTELTPAQKLMLNSLQGILRYDCDTEEAFYEKLYGTSALDTLTITPSQRRAATLTNWGIGTGVLLAAVAAALMVFQPGAIIPKDSLAGQLGYEGRMKDITSVLLYGETVGQTRSEFSFAGKDCLWEQAQWQDTILYGDGSDVAYVGKIEDISDFAQLKNLTELSISGNQVSDLSPLFGLRKLEYLDIAGNPVRDLSGIEALRSLQTLCIANTQVDSLAPLDGCDNLRTVYVDKDQYASFANDGNARAYTLVEVGPKEDLRNILIHIFGGFEEYGDYDATYSIYVQTKSWQLYDGYRYSFYKNGKTVRITGLARPPVFDGSSEMKLHLFLNQSDFGTYDPSAEYVLVVTYKNWSASYRVWHKSDNAKPSGETSQLIDSSGF